MDNRLILALDYTHPDEARKMVEKLGPAIEFYKVGQIMLANGGLEFCKELKEQYGKRVFLDLKLFDIGNTVEKAVMALSEFQFDFLTVHGDPYVVEAAVRGRGESSTKILAITILTSLDREDLDGALYQNGDLDTLVSRRAEIAFEAGADGVISSPREVGLIRGLKYGKSKLIVTPGIRPTNSEKNDQKRTLSPREAILNGSDYLVVGRAITQSPDPMAVLENIVETLPP